MTKIFRFSLSHLDSVTVDCHQHQGDDNDGGHGHSNDHHGKEGGLGHGVLLDNILQETKCSHPATLALGVSGVGVHQVTEPA